MTDENTGHYLELALPQPKVWLNATQTKSGADEMTVTSYNIAGTSITFTDPAGGQTGSLKLGVEDIGSGLIGWIDVTVSAAGGGVSIPIAMYHYMHNVGSRL